jgi:PAS domain S-box-containing protein
MLTKLGHGAHDEIFRKLLDTAPDAVIVVDEHGMIVLVNLQTERMFGYARDQLLGQLVEILIPERARPNHGSLRRGFVTSPKVRPMGSGLELHGRKQDGSEFPIEISLSPLPTEQGMLVSAAIRDITERRQNEQRIRRVQEHLLSAVESIQGAFAIFDAGDRLVLCNSSYRSWFGRDVSGELVGKTFVQVLDANMQSGTFDVPQGQTQDWAERYISYHRDPSGALDVRTKDGRSARIVERRTPEGGSVTTVWDITEDVEHEEQLRRAQAQAEAASSAKSEFLSSMSHELRTPLNAILGFAQLLQRDKKSPLSERHRERIEHVLKGGEHLLHLINEVLDLSRIEAGHVTVSLESVDVSEVLADVESTLEAMAARAEMRLDFAQPPADFPRVKADRTRFKQILMNYGSNAIKYGRKHGSASFRAQLRDGSVHIEVSDDGIGIPEDKQDKIFSPFHRAGQETGTIEGTGIGLAITKRLAELMGGSVGFASTQGEGSRFWIELPIYERAAHEAQAADAEKIVSQSLLARSTGTRHLIVYVEDNPSNIAFMEDLLGDFEHVELLVAPTAEIGIELIRARQPKIVIMDINLPGMSGFEAAKQLRSWPETRDIPIIALSAAAMVGEVAKNASAGFYRYLTKPVKVDELAGALDELLVSAKE